MGVAAASYWLMGGEAQKSSIVRSIPARRVERRIDGTAAPAYGLIDQRDGTVGVHVVRAVLGVVFEDEDRRLLPVRGCGKSLP